MKNEKKKGREMILKITVEFFNSHHKAYRSLKEFMIFYVSI
jgi:hypothetical protein